MPLHQDAYISDIVVVIDETPERSFDSVVAELKKIGLEIREQGKDSCTIEGTVDAGLVGRIDDLPGVDYVRTVFTYIADYPPGDPRDRDLTAREYET